MSAVWVFFVFYFRVQLWFVAASFLGAVWRLRDPGKEPGHFQGWHPVYSQGQQVQMQYSKFSAEHPHWHMHSHTHLFCPTPPCRLDFIYDLFEHVGSRSGDETLKMGTARRKPTVSSQFRVSPKLLMMPTSFHLGTHNCVIKQTFGSAAYYYGITQSIWHEGSVHKVTRRGKQ